MQVSAQSASGEGCQRWRGGPGEIRAVERGVAAWAGGWVNSPQKPANTVLGLPLEIRYLRRLGRRRPTPNRVQPPSLHRNRSLVGSNARRPTLRDHFCAVRHFAILGQAVSARPHPAVRLSNVARCAAPQASSGPRQRARGCCATTCSSSRSACASGLTPLHYGGRRRRLACNAGRPRQSPPDLKLANDAHTLLAARTLAAQPNPKSLLTIPILAGPRSHNGRPSTSRRGCSLQFPEHFLCEFGRPHIVARRIRTHLKANTKCILERLLRRCVVSENWNQLLAIWPRPTLTKIRHLTPSHPTSNNQRKNILVLPSIGHECATAEKGLLAEKC